MSASALPSSSDLQGVGSVDDILQTLHVADPVWQAFLHQVGDQDLTSESWRRCPKA